MRIACDILLTPVEIKCDVWRIIINNSVTCAAGTYAVRIFGLQASQEQHKVDIIPPVSGNSASDPM